MLIDELKDFNKKNLAPFSIFHSKNSCWKNLNFFFNIIYACMIIVICIHMIILPITLIPRYIWCSLLVLPVIFIYFFIKFTQRKNLEIIKEKYNEKYNLNIKNEWDYKIIQKIHYLKLSEFFIENNLELSKNDISSMIKYLKYEIKASSYTYQSPGIILTLSSALIGTFLGAILSKNTVELLYIIKIIASLFFLICLMFIYTEHFVIKDFRNRKQYRHIRLIRTLENYKLNLCEA